MEDKVIVEIQSVEVLAPVHRKQLLTYLRWADKRLGLLINFQVALIKDGITRIGNGLEDDYHAGSVEADFPTSGSPDEHGRARSLIKDLQKAARAISLALPP